MSAGSYRTVSVSLGACPGRSWIVLLLGSSRYLFGHNPMSTRICHRVVLVVRAWCTLSFSLQLGSWQRPTTVAVGHGQTPSGSGYGFVFLSGRDVHRGTHSMASEWSLLAGSIVLPVRGSPGFHGYSSRCNCRYLLLILEDIGRYRRACCTSLSVVGSTIAWL